MRSASWLLSLLLHVVLIVLSIYTPWSGGSLQIDLDKPVYEVELVRMPEQKEPVEVSKGNRPEVTEPKRDQKPAPKKTKPAARPKPAPVPSPQPSAPKSKPVQIAKQDKRPQATKRPRKKPPQPKASKPAQASPRTKTPESVLQEAMRDVSQEAEKSAPKETKTDAQLLAEEIGKLGQELAQQGLDIDQLGRSTSAQGIESVYGNLVKNRIKSNWRFPDMGADSGLKATVELNITAQGQISDYSLVRPSGQRQFDSSVLRAVGETEQLEEPPNPKLQTIRITFHLQDMR